MEIAKLDSKISWTVALAGAIMNALIMIPTKLSGLFFVEILDRYNVGRSLAGYPAFIITLVRCSGGPLAGYFAEKFGMNEVMILGSVLSAVGVLACFFAEDIAVVIVFFGIIHGCGIAFNNTMLPLIVKVCFKKYVALAFGVTQAGASLGAFAASPLLLWIFRSYSTSGGFLIVGAIMFNCLPIVMILNILVPNRLYGKSDDSKQSTDIPNKYLELAEVTTVTSSKDNSMTNNIGSRKENAVKARVENVASEIQNSFANNDSIALVLNSSASEHEEVLPGKTDDVELNMCITSLTEIENSPRWKAEKDQMEELKIISKIKPEYITPEKEEKEAAANRKINELGNNFTNELIPASTIPTVLTTNNCEETSLRSNDYTDSKSNYKSKAAIINRDILCCRVGYVKYSNPTKDSNSDTTPCASVINVSTSSNSENCEKTQRRLTMKTEEIFPRNFNIINAGSLESVKPNDQNTIHKKEPQIDKKSTIGSKKLKEKTTKESLMIFLDLTFWNVLVSYGFFVCVLVIFWATMIDFSRDKNVDRSKEVYLLMTLPIAELIGRLGLVWITDGNYLTTTNFCMLSFIGVGCSCSIMALAQGFYVVLASIFAFGVISSGLITVLPIMIFEFFDSDKHTMGQASKSSLFGPLSFLNGPLIGYFRGTLGSYAWLYHTLAAFSVFCGALIALIPVLARRRDERKNRS